MDSDYLNRCMERYWKRWEVFARQQCFNRFIPRESHEVLMDAIMTLLRQPEGRISDLIRDEKTGRPVILCWVYRAIINYAKIYHVRCLRMNSDCDLTALADDSIHQEDEVSDDLFIPCGKHRHARVKIVFYSPAHSVTPGEAIFTGM